MQTFIEICTASYIPEYPQPCRLPQTPRQLQNADQKSYFEKRIELYDFINLDLDIGRLVFIFTNDLTNNHYETVTYENIRECVGSVRELIGLQIRKHYS
ncbi:hypothetical protein MASR1M12_37480 [Erysipelotrichia bacterium]